MSLLWTILQLALLSVLAYKPYLVESGPWKSNYRRSHEVEQECKAISSGRSDTAMGSSPSSSTQDGPLLRWAREKELSFQNGDWEQAAGNSPLLPFQLQSSTDMGYDPSQFASFWITDVNQKRDGTQDALQVSAVLQLAITTDDDLSYLIGDGIENFEFPLDSSLLTILLEGLYTESEGRSLCMLGCTLLPHRSSNVSEPWPSDRLLHSTQYPPTSRSCNLMLQLHYPKEMSLTSRSIRGVLKSLSNPEEWSYFDPISVVSQMGDDARYQFGAGGLVEVACKGVTPTVEDNDIYRRDDICSIVRESLNRQQFEPLSNWKCNQSEEYCTKLGPFKSKGGLPVPRNASKILIQDVRCVDLEDDRPGKAANISAVFRAIPPRHNQNLAFSQTGLDGLTLVAEGMWSSGKLCMIACAYGSQDGCKIRICLYIPTELSITQRSVLVGTISSLNDNSAISFDPLTFHQPVRHSFRPSNPSMHYNYTKIKIAGAIIKREEPSGESEKIRPSLLKYPSTGSYYSLSEDLRVHLPIISKKNFTSPSYLDLDIIAIEKSVVIWANFSAEEGLHIAADRHAGPKEEGKFVKVAAQLCIRHIRDIPQTRALVIHGEGIYNPRTGKMYLVGCKEVSAAWQVLRNNSFDLVDGLDCNVEVIVRFPPENAAWLINPTIAATITSRRTKDDPFFFPQVILQTSQNLYRRQRQEIVARQRLEGGLRLVTLSLMAMCTASQLISTRKNKDSAPFISLVMLGVQAMGYGVPLIVGDEALYAKLQPHRHAVRKLDLGEWYRIRRSSQLGEGEWTQDILFLGKLLFLVAFLLNLHLCQKVVKARMQLRAHERPLDQPGRAPSERKVLTIFLLIHAIGFMLVLTIHSLNDRTNQVIYDRSDKWQGRSQYDIKWVKEMLMEYGGIMQDLFLLPQVLGGAIWDTQGKPLRSVYYIGLTILCMLLRAYDTSIKPFFDPHFAYEYVYAKPTFDFYSLGGYVAIPLLALLLAIAIYAQQNWKILRRGSSKRMQYGSNIFERLPSKLFEDEVPPS